MDSVSQYRTAVRRVLSRYADLDSRGTTEADLRTFCAFDDERGQYVVFRLGWSGQRRVKGIVLHLRIHDGKVWLEENGTDREIASDLAALGVPPRDIVIGFHHPSLRESPPLAVA
jgi:XisI protein